MSSFEHTLAHALANPDRTLTELDRIDCEQDLATFLEGGWRYIDPAPFVGGWHIDAVCEHLEAVTYGNIRHLLINIPPRCAKSSTVSVAWPAWTWALQSSDFNQGTMRVGPSVQFLFASYAQPLSFRDSLKMRRLVQSPWYQDRWGDRFQLTGDQNAKQRFENDQGGYRLATSVDGALTGEGGSIIGIDDPHNTREIESEAERNAVINWWDEAMSTRLNDPKTGAYVVIMQRLHEQDLSGHVLAKNHPDWTHLCLPMRYEADRHCYTSIGWNDPRAESGQELLWPERFDERSVANLELALGSYAAAGQLQQRPAPRGGGIFKRDWWQLYPPEGEKFDPQTRKPVRALAYPKMEYILVSTDTAMTEKLQNDPTACSVWGVYRVGGYAKVMLMDAWKERLEFHALCEKLIKTGRHWKCDRMLVEAKANGISVAQEIIRTLGGEEFGVTLRTPKGDKVARAYSVQHLWENKLISAPDRRWADRVIDEMSTFPRGAEDDLTDSATQALRFLRDSGMLQFVEERDRDLAAALGPHGVQEPLYDS